MTEMTEKKCFLWRKNMTEKTLYIPFYFFYLVFKIYIERK
jgi:hypothetical protein